MAQHSYCKKEKEISSLETSVKLLNEKVIGNGKGDGLAVTVPLLKQSVDRLDISVQNLDRNLELNTRQHDREEGAKAGTDRLKRRQQWLIGLLVGIITTQFVILFTLLAKFMKL